MATQTVVKRVDALEEEMTELRDNAAKVEEHGSQISQLRTEMHREFFAVRSEFAAVRTEMATEFAAVRTEMRAGDDETRSLMRVLHEDVIDRIASLQDGWPARRTSRSRKPKG